MEAIAFTEAKLNFSPLGCVPEAKKNSRKPGNI